MIIIKFMNVLKELLQGRETKGCIYIYMQPDLFVVITFDLDMIKTQIGFHSKAEMLVDNIWGMGAPYLSRKFT